jgi:hypothetical protein
MFNGHFINNIASNITSASNNTMMQQSIVTFASSLKTIATPLSTLATTYVMKFSGMDYNMYGMIYGLIQELILSFEHFNASIIYI